MKRKSRDWDLTMELSCHAGCPTDDLSTQPLNATFSHRNIPTMSCLPNLHTHTFQISHFALYKALVQLLKPRKFLFS